MVKIKDVEPRTPTTGSLTTRTGTTFNWWRNSSRSRKQVKGVVTQGMIGTTRQGTAVVICCLLVLFFMVVVWMTLATTLARSVIFTMQQQEQQQQQQEVDRNGGGGGGAATNKMNEGNQMLPQEVQPHKESLSKAGRRNMELNQQGASRERRTRKHKNVLVEASASSSCPYQSLQDLTKEERFPQASPSRHMVTPPIGGWVDLVCCETTKGPWNLLVHENWAPLGSKRFLTMVQSNYFSSSKGVPLMRCVSNFLCQFGLNGPISQQFNKQIPDDPNWLPPGKDHRNNKWNVKRFQKGYFSYAGAGPNTRSNQFFVALNDNGALAGGSPWEVPWGELVGDHSFDVLDQIYTGYGEHGPKQGWLHRHNSSDPQLQKDFPLLDYITSCHIVDRELQQPHHQPIVLSN